MAGTLALQFTTYGDMLLRGRAASGMPAQAAAKLAGIIGVDLDGDDDASSNRREALGTLMDTRPASVSWPPWRRSPLASCAGR